MRIDDAINQGAEILRDACVPNHRLDAQTLLAFALDHDRTYLIINNKSELSEDIFQTFQSFITRREGGEPLQYITGRQEFFGLEIEVNQHVLIPRPETELLVEEVINLAKSHSPVILDIGTGSGCIAVAIARELPNSKVFAADISFDALMTARRNANRHLSENRIAFTACDLIDAFAEQPIFDFIVSNPPYVTINDLDALQREVKEWEPKIALSDFGDGLSFYRRLLERSPSRLNPGGKLIFEMGYNQAEDISNMVNRKVWTEPILLDDLQGIPRIMVLNCI